LSLPVELWASILLHVTRPEDVKAVADTCQLMRDALLAPHRLVDVGGVATDALLKRLRGVRRIELGGSSSLTDEGVSMLAGARWVGLQGCTAVTDVGVRALAGVETICLKGCVRITNSGVCALAGVRDIDLTDCCNVSNECCCALAGAERVVLAGTCVGDAGVQHLQGVQEVSLQGCLQVTDASMPALAGAHTVNLAGTSVTDEGLAYLAGVRRIDLSRLRGVSDVGLKAIAGAEAVSLWMNTDVTDKGIIALGNAGLRELAIRQVEHVSPACLYALSEARALRFDGAMEIAVAVEMRQYLRNVPVIEIDWYNPPSEKNIKTLMRFGVFISGKRVRFSPDT